MEQLPLKDIHLPQALGIWPPAPGWWLLTLLLPLLIFAIRYLYQRLRRQSAVKTALKILAAIEQDQSGGDLQTLTALSMLLKRVAVSTASRTDVAALSGPAWLAYLDSSLDDAPFSQGAGRCLANVQYRRALPADIDLDAVLKLCERWLRQQGKSKQRVRGQ